MRISEADWAKYRDRLRAVDQTAAQLMQEYMVAHGYAIDADLIAYAYSLSTKYGEAAAELACIMYDDMATAWMMSGGKNVIKSAIPAPTATLEEVERAVRAAEMVSPANVPGAVSRLVKQAGADTTLQNAARDGAEFAWVPHGDTCAFCIMLASGGWRRAGGKTLKGGHATHIHANCDCAYAVRFSSDDGVAGYDPGRFEKIYKDADGKNSKDKINAIRRDIYAERADEINAQKRAAYAKRKEREELLKTD